MTATEIGELVDQLAGPLMLYARQWIPHPEDVVQEAFLRFVRRPQPREKAVPWLYRVVRNAAFDSLRANKRRLGRETAHSQGRDWFVEPSVDGIDADFAVEALERLPIETREIMVAHLWGGLTFDQIADLVGESASTAHRRYQAGLRELRSRLEGPCPAK